MDDPGIRRVVDRLGIASEVMRVATLGKTSDCDVTVVGHKAEPLPGGQQLWTASLATKEV